MKKWFAWLLCIVLLCSAACAEEGEKTYQTITYSSCGYTISLKWEEGIEEDAELRETLLDIFFSQYPAIRETLGTTDERSVTLHLTHGDNYILSSDGKPGGIFMDYEQLRNDPGAKNTLIWFFVNQVISGHPNPERDPEIDVLSLGVQYYFENVFAVEQDALVWLTPYEEGQQLTDGNQVAAAFLTWLADNYGEVIPVRLNRVLHDGYYDHHDFWVNAVGNSLENLWQQYAGQAGE